MVTMENQPLKLDLACGQVKQTGFIGVDYKPCAGVDIVADLTKFPWDFAADNSVDEIFCSHYIEHTPDLIAFMQEVYRILKVGSKATFYAPYYTSMRCWQDPTHTRAISEATFLYYNKAWREQNKLDHYNITCDFDYTYGYILTPEWQSRHEEAKMFAIKHYWNVVNDIVVTLTKR